MVPTNRNELVGVWVPVVRFEGWPQRCAVLDAAGAAHETAAGGPYSIFDDATGKGRMGLFARIVEELADGLYRVRVRDGIVLTVRADSAHQLERAA